MRERLLAAGVPYVIENVKGAPLLDPIVLCGTMFPGLRVLRHRLFESNVALTAPPRPASHPLTFTHGLATTRDPAQRHLTHIELAAARALPILSDYPGVPGSPQRGYGTQAGCRWCTTV